MVQGQIKGLNYSGELLDSINEYSVHFKQLGLSADQMFAVFVNSASNGAFNLDKVGDAVKELGIRVKEGNKDSVLAFQELGLNSNEMIKKFNAGGEEAQEAFFKIFKALREVDDQTKLNSIGTALMGTMFEDLGKDAVLALGDINTGFDMANNSSEQARLANISLKDSLEMISRTIDTTLISSLKETFEPILAKIAPKIQEIAVNVSEWMEKNNGLATVLMTIIGVIGSVLVVGGTLITTIGTMTIMWGAISAVVAGASISFLLNS